MDTNPQDCTHAEAGMGSSLQSTCFPSAFGLWLWSDDHHRALETIGSNPSYVRGGESIISLSECKIPKPQILKIILFRLTDLILKSKIKKAVQGEFEIQDASSADEVENILHESSESIVVCDLETVGPQLDALLMRCRKKGTRVVGFYPHIRGDIRALALAKGVDDIIPRSALERTLKIIADDQARKAI